ACTPQQHNDYSARPCYEPQTTTLKRRESHTQAERWHANTYMRESTRQAEYDIASLYTVSVYCFVTKACARRPGAATSVKCRRRERRTLLEGAAGELAGATRLRQKNPAASQLFERMHILCRKGTHKHTHARQLTHSDQVPKPART
ncbi:MAG: hypothetical protein ACK56F_20305, partial [bacterium]